MAVALYAGAVHLDAFVVVYDDVGQVATKKLYGSASETHPKNWGRYNGLSYFGHFASCGRQLSAIS
eukprot:7690870-Prorocentrum_lima.AAC.1